jgi:hypothetical protein
LVLERENQDGFGLLNYSFTHPSVMKSLASAFQDFLVSFLSHAEDPSLTSYSFPTGRVLSTVLLKAVMNVSRSFNKQNMASLK